MFDMSENGKEAVIKYLKKTFKDKRNTESASKNFENELDKPIKKSGPQNPFLTKTLIVKL
jgi:hypothetical protein